MPNYNNPYADKVQQKLEELDVDKGMGIFANAQYQAVPGTRFLIVSYGGTGADALEAVKTNLSKYMDAEDLKSKVAFLVIDTDQTILEKTVKVKEDGTETTKKVQRFDTSEFFWLNNKPGRQALAIGDAGVLSWINPKLPLSVAANDALMDGNGASGIRQLGRAMLYPAQVIQDFENRFRTLVNGLTDDNGDNLKIFVISGISGGTGSGTVVDATYLMHYFISGMPGGIPARTEFAGFLLLPPTGKSRNAIDIQKGNRNGIAALKEIDRFMNVAQRGERYRAVMGNVNLDISENIFKTCYLLDGGTAQVAYSNARERANTVLADCLLDMITSLPIDGNANGNTQVVDAFMSDASTFARAMQQTTSEKLAPREANYCYCALGHGKTLIPLDLMKAYVAKRLFDQMYQKFSNAGRVTPEAVKSFVENLKKLPADNELRKNLDKKLRPLFKNPAQGPYYVINLLHDAIAEMEKQTDELRGKTIVVNKAEKLARLEALTKAARAVNNSTFTVYVLVMEEMKKHLEAEHRIICDSELLERYGGSTYTFFPISFGGTDQKSQIVQEYLDGLVNARNVQTLIQGLLAEMDEHRREWTDLAERTQPGQKPGFAAAARIRAFWQEKITEIVNASVEDYLLKLYSGDRNASWPRNNDPDQRTVEAMEKAAKEIVDRMWGTEGIAKPLAELRTNILTMDKFNGHNTLLIPQAAPHLRQYVAAAARSLSGGTALVVAGSLVNDRISCYAQYTGIPAFMFGWVERAEPDYEKLLANSDVGLHMSETRDGEQWADFPNLMVESIWPMSVNTYDNPREHRIDQLAARAFSEAREFGLALPVASAAAAGAGAHYHYKLHSLPAANLPDRRLLKDMDIEPEGTATYKAAAAALQKAVEEKADALFALCENWAEEDPVAKDGVYDALLGKGQTFTEKELSFAGTVTTPLMSADGRSPEGWEEDLAGRLLRTLPVYMDEVRETVMVLKVLYEKIQKAQASETLMREFSHYFVAGLFRPSEDGSEWFYWDSVEEEEKVLAELVVIDEAQMKTKEFYLYKSFSQKAEEIIAAVGSQYKKLIINEETDKLDNAKLIQLRDASREQAAAIKALREGKDGIASLSFAKMARQQGHSDGEIEEIKAFYKAFQKELEAARMNVMA